LNNLAATVENAQWSSGSELLLSVPDLSQNSAEIPAEDQFDVRASAFSPICVDLGLVDRKTSFLELWAGEDNARFARRAHHRD
jgi:hypothetical protein